MHFIQYSPEMEMARSQGGLHANSFVRLRRLFGINGEPTTDVQELGHADMLLKSRTHFEAEAQKLMERGTLPTEDGWGGWLGRYQATLREAALHALNLQKVRKDREIQRARGLDR